MLDANGIASRRPGFKKKRKNEYTVPSPDYLWYLDGHDKLVLYGKKKAGGGIEVTHIARQLADGSWSSKLGSLPLIRHLRPDDVAGPTYGVPYVVYVRKVK